MKTSKRLKFTLVIPVLIFMSVMFMATHCDDYNREMLFKLVGDVPEKVYNCVEDTCEITVQIATDRVIDAIRIRRDGNPGYDVLPFEILEDDDTYQVTITLERGVNNITLKGLSGLDSSELSFTIECVCPEEGAPEISWDPDKPPTDTTTEDTAKLNITSDKELDALKVTTNGQEQVTQNPEAEQDGDEYNYEATVELQDGDNEIEVQGENENGPSNSIQHQIEKGQPPVIDFAGEPPSEVNNCVMDECEVTISIICENGCDQITHQVGDNPPLTSEATPNPDDSYSVTMTLPRGSNVVKITAKNRFGTSNTLIHTIVCICPDEPLPPFLNELDAPPTATSDDVQIKVTADQIIEIFTVRNNELEPNVIESPVYDEENEDGYLYSFNQSVVEGDNHLRLIGENANGISNQVEHTVKRGRPPDIFFNPVPPEEVYNCVNDECTHIIKIHELSGVINPDWKLTNLVHQVGSGGDLIENSVEPDDENNFSIPVNLQKGENVITITGFNRFGSDSLTCTIECVCEEPSSPTIHLEPDLPPTTTNDTVPLNIKSDQELDQITVLNSEIAEPNVIDNPEPVENEDGFLYQTNQPLVEGDNDITVQGKNENGFSNKIEKRVLQGCPPILGFNPEPPPQVYNCDNSECTYVLKINDYTSENYESMPLTSLTYSVDTGEEGTCSLEPDDEGNYTIPVTLIEGNNTITVWATNQYGEDTISCTIECVCDSPPPGYTKEQLIGETEIPKPIGLDFYPDYQQQRNFLNVLTKTAENDTEIQHGELTGGPFMNKYPDADLPDNPIGYAFEASTKKNLLLLPDKVQRLEDDNETLVDLPLPFPEGQTAVPGQIDHDYGPGTTSVITQDSNGHSTLNVYNGLNTDQFPFGTVVVGLHNMNASENEQLNRKTAMVELNVNLTGSRDSGQAVFTFDPVTEETSTLFEVPLSHGTVIDILPDVFNDYETVQFIILTVKNETEYWVNIYSQAGERLHAFKTHDLNDLEQTSGETIFYKVVMASDWPDGKLYIIHSEFPGVQVWAPEE